MKVPILYLDTSVIGGYFDDEFKEATRKLWRLMEAGKYRFVTSTITADELAEAPSHVRDLWADTFTPEMILDVTDDMDQLAAAYMAQAFSRRSTPTMPAMWRSALWPGLITS